MMHDVFRIQVTIPSGDGRKMRSRKFAQVASRATATHMVVTKEAWKAMLDASRYVRDGL